ncbi:NYN domain-containing protein [Aquipuribacter nitratireducens]|uniref:NYN domain-containing protein n=1 Tax=Aquipuribacter nitratireducens TaxID=650104 RepID=A0ABW0GLI2_9MICO
MGSRAAQVAVFIDAENLAVGAHAALPGRENPVPYEALELLCRDYGDAVIRRAYADWSRPQSGRYQEDLALNGVDLVQVARFGTQQKNAADVRMAVDAMETLIAHPDVATFVLVAGDGDYSPLVQKLREFGKRVVGVGTEASASKRLVSVCSEYKYWATLVAAVDPTARPTVDSAFRLAEARPLLVAALERSSSSSGLASWVKNSMLSLDPSFDERNYGCRSFRDFLDRFPAHVVVEQGEADVRVTLRRPTRTGRSTATA